MGGGVSVLMLGTGFGISPDTRLVRREIDAEQGGFKSWLEKEVYL
jgi:hypothetical protein